jgi:hypothetical protein
VGSVAVTEAFRMTSTAPAAAASALTQKSTKAVPGDAIPPPSVVVMVVSVALRKSRRFEGDEISGSLASKLTELLTDQPSSTPPSGPEQTEMVLWTVAVRITAPEASTANVALLRSPHEPDDAGKSPTSSIVCDALRRAGESRASAARSTATLAARLHHDAEVAPFSSSGPHPSVVSPRRGAGG